MFAVLGGQLQLFEGPEGYRPSEDSFWLSCLLPPLHEGAIVLDMGCGTGAILYSYGLRYSNVHLHGIDHDTAMIAAAQKASRQNNLPAILTEANALTHTFDTPYDLCVANPPFYIEGREDKASTTAKQNVRQTSDLLAWLTTLLNNTKPHGYAALICHTADTTQLIEHATAIDASCVRQTDIQSSAKKPAKRSVLVFKNEPALPLQHTTLQTFDPRLRERALNQNVSLYT